MLRITQRLVFVSCVALAAVNCNDKSSPTAASDVPPSATPSTPATPVAGQGAVQVVVDPNPVPFSGAPITDAPGCVTSKNTWFYEHVFTETSGTEVTFTGRVDSFDGFTINTISGLSLVVPANGTLRIRSRWCSGNPVNHEAQSSFSGADARGNAITLAGPKVRLLAPGS
jgi:hypothetical protein